MLMIPFGILWSEANPSDMVEVDPSTESILKSSSDSQKLNYSNPSIQLLSQQPEETAFFFHKEIYNLNPNIKVRLV